ncbi:TonB-dependent receptor plug domain-containing protein, partial [Delftia acidovorans]|uniref:TonB-dependent receptor plug domain-containing protein n=1 Tax=Delftia acidovorans TaxID=80866 RepID=UPI0035A0950D
MTAFFFPAKPLPRLRPLPLALSAAALLSMPALAQGQDPSSGPGPAAVPASASPQEQTLLPAVEVVGRTASGAYHTDEAAGAKTDLPLRELPQSVRVITRQAMDGPGATKLDDVLDYVGGVSRQNNFGGLWDNIVIRGLPGDQNV